MNFDELQTVAWERLNLPGAPTGDTQTRIRRHINIWQQRILSRPGFERILDNTITFTTVNGTAQYAMPQALARIRAISERTTNRIRLVERNVGWLRQVDPGLTAIGQATTWIPISWSSVAVNPGTTGVWVASSSASDTTQTMSIEGVLADGTRTGPQQAILNGTTRVQLGSYTNFIEVDKAFLSDAAVGTVSLFDNSVGGNTLLTIPIGKTSVRALVIQLFPKPSAALTYYVDYTRFLETMSDPNDEPFLPEPYHWILAYAAIYEEWFKKDDTRSQQIRADLEKGISDCRRWLVNDPDYRPVPGLPVERPSVLGSWFPAGS